MLPRFAQQSIAILILATMVFVPITPIPSTSAFATTAASDIKLELVTRLGGWISCVEVSGSFAFIGQGGTFVVMDVSDPNHMIHLANLIVPDFINQIKVIDSLAYLADGNGGLQIIDVSSPSTPQFKGSYSSDGSIEDVEVSNGYAYLIEKMPTGNSLRILDISDPAAPYLVGDYTVTTDRWFDNIAVEDQMVYLSGSSLTILNVNDPPAPVLQSVTPLDSWFSDVQVIDGLALISGSTFGASLILYDVSNPFEPTIVSEVSSLINWDDEQNRLAVKGNLAFVYNNLILRIFDFTNLKDPVEVNTYYLSAMDLKVVGSQVYMAWGSLQVFDFSSIEIPTLLGSYYLYGTVYDAQVVNSYLYTTDYNQKLHILNIANLDDLHSESALPDYGHDLKVIGNLLYLNRFNAGFEIWDIADPRNPVLLSLYKPDHGSYTTMTTDGNYVYITELLGGTRGTGLNIIDVLDPANPVFKGVVDNIGNAVEIEVVGSLVYIAIGSGGLSIVDVSNVTQPTIIGRYQDSHSKSVEIIGNVAYVTDYSQGLVMLDISNPANPVLISSYLPENTRAGVVRVVDGLAYLSDDYGEMVLINISDPLNPELLQRVSVPGYISNIEVVGGYIYVASREGGINIFHQSNGNEAPIEISFNASSVAENQPADTDVGALSITNPDENSSYTYSLVRTIACPGTDNGVFDISGNTLRTGASFNFEDKSNYSVCVRAAQLDGLGVDQVFTISVTNVNEAPTGLLLSGSNVKEKQPINTVVGTFSSTDPDDGETLSYSLVSTENCPGTDNAGFNLLNNTLRTSAIFDHRIKSSYTLCIRTTDHGGLNLDKSFTISVTTTIFLPFILDQ